MVDESDSTEGTSPSDPDDLEWPVGFMAGLAIAALYLGWRLIQMVGRLFDWIA